MKETELQKLIAGKDLSKPEDLKALTDAINNDTNSLVSKRDETIDVLKKENESLKANGALAAKDKKDLDEKLAKANDLNDFLNKKNYIYKNINNNLEEEDVKDLLLMTKSRMAENNKLKFEDVVTQVANKRQFIKPAKGADAVIPPAPVVSKQPAGQPSVENGTKVERSEALDWLGIKHK